MSIKTSPNDNLPYTELLAGSTEHRQFINNAILTRNYSHMAALKNRTAKTIHLVNNWFFYAIMKIDHEEDVIVIYTPDDQGKMERLFSEQ